MPFGEMSVFLDHESECEMNGFPPLPESRNSGEISQKSRSSDSRLRNTRTEKYIRLFSKIIIISRKYNECGFAHGKNVWLDQPIYLMKYERISEFRLKLTRLWSIKSLAWLTWTQNSGNFCQYSGLFTRYLVNFFFRVTSDFANSQFLAREQHPEQRPVHLSGTHLSRNKG